MKQTHKPKKKTNKNEEIGPEMSSEISERLMKEKLYKTQTTFTFCLNNLQKH